MNAASGRKRRATRACCHCRGRKVRCDVMEYGSPCTNCRLDRVDCMTLERRRKRTADEIKRCEQSCLSIQRPASELRVLAQSKDTEDPQLEGLSPVFTRDHETGFILPDYTRPLPAHLDHDSANFLTEKGALCVPATCFRNKLLTSYAHHVHSDMPLLDLDGLIRPIIQNKKDHPVSLLLLQAVLFAASAFVNIEDIRAAGFESRIQARTTFFHRARLLYDFDYEEDRLNLVQSLLLMSYWDGSASGLKDGWHWLGLSLAVAQTIGLHRKTDLADEGTTRVRTRLWWCIYARDCLMALDMRHSMHISNLEFNTQPITIEHFELELSEATVNSIGYSGLLGNAEHQRSLAVIFIEKVRLCHWAKHVRQTQYSVQFDPVARVVPTRSTEQSNQVAECAQKIEAWATNLAPEAQYTMVNSVKVTKAEGLLHVQRSSLRMVYLALVGALYRPHAQPSNADLRELPIRYLFSAAEQVTIIIQELGVLDLTKFLPATAVTALYSAGIAHLLGSQATTTTQGVSPQLLRICLDCLTELREIYPTSGSAASFLESAVSRVLPFYPAESFQQLKWQNCMGPEIYGDSPVPSSQWSCTTYAQSASDATENAESPFSGPSPKSVPATGSGTGYDNFMVIDVNSEITLSQMMDLPSSRLVQVDKGLL